MELLWFCMGSLLGTLITIIYKNVRTTGGILKIRQDEDRTYLFLELTKDTMNDIRKKDIIWLKIKRTHE